MLKLIDYYLDRITMYRLVLYYLLVLVAAACILSFFDIIHYNPLGIIYSSSVLVLVCYLTNRIFSYVFKAPTNVESVYITALILACLINPFRSFGDMPLLIFAGVLAISSKYILAFKKKHIFNPVAIGVVLTSIGFSGTATWWIGNTYLIPIILAGGLLIIRKIQKGQMVLVFGTVSLMVISLFSLQNANYLTRTLEQVIMHSAYFFFASVMLTEPLTLPPTRKLQFVYAGIVGVLYSPQVHLGGLYITPELGLAIGNIFSFIVSLKSKLVLSLANKIKVTPEVVDFVFKPTEKIDYLPGQYMEWTFVHPKTDGRGNRRYFTLASSPTEETLRIGVKFNKNGSSYKRSLEVTPKFSSIVAGHLAGDFILPKDKGVKLAFVAGGIGITPFRSMLKFLLDTSEKRDIVVFYSNKTESDIAYKNILDEANKELGIQTIFTLTDLNQIPKSWKGERGRVTQEMIKKKMPDWQERVFYLSGPHAMVEDFENTVRKMGVLRKNIKKDFFPGFA